MRNINQNLKWWHLALVAAASWGLMKLIGGENIYGVDQNTGLIAQALNALYLIAAGLAVVLLIIEIIDKVFRKKDAEASPQNPA